jgi:hypothetical protein
MQELTDFPGYFITEDGKVYSKITNQWLKGFISHDGYHRVTFKVNGKVIKKFVHRLVAETYIPNSNNLNSVNHKDEVKLNNSIENLEWMDIKENCRYSFCKYNWTIQKIDTKETFITNNLRLFCSENNLVPHAMRKTLCGAYSQHKGFKVLEKKLINQQSH